MQGFHVPMETLPIIIMVKMPECRGHSNRLDLAWKTGQMSDPMDWTRRGKLLFAFEYYAGLSPTVSDGQGRNPNVSHWLKPNSTGWENHVRTADYTVVPVLYSSTSTS